jgi:hypothetical protein
MVMIGTWQRQILPTSFPLYPCIIRCTT